MNQSGEVMFRNPLQRFILFLTVDDRGASMVEYALLVVLIAIVALVAVQFAGTELSETYSDINSGLEWAGSK
ncbi:MAG: Flp family type IVb pilin [Actinobacteria bacterium]|nr:Flp family type IVb pilin [Actinomycetota bacterium]